MRRARTRRRSGAYRGTIKVTYTFEADPEFKRLVEATPRGMPYWSGTGPPGTVCEQCSFYGYGMQHPYSCYLYFEMMSEHGAVLPAETPSCRHFQRRWPGPPDDILRR